MTGAPETRHEGNLRLFAKETRIYMPDFVQAADAVVGKLGYGTVAEVWSLGRPYAFVTRESFRESGALTRWMHEHAAGFEIPGRTFAGGATSRAREASRRYCTTSSTGTAVPAFS